MQEWIAWSLLLIDESRSDNKALACSTHFTSFKSYLLNEDAEKLWAS